MRRPLAVVSLLWIGLVAALGVLAPIIASGHPIVLWPMDDGVRGPATSPLLRHLSASDWLLIAGLPVAAAFVLWPARAGRGERWRWIALAIAQAGATVALTQVLRAWSLDREAPRWLATLAQRETFIPVACVAIAALVILVLIFAPGTRGAARRSLLFIAVGAACAYATAQTWRQSPAVFDYLERQQRGRIEAVFTLVQWSPAQRPGDRDAKLLPPGATEGQALARAILGALPSDVEPGSAHLKRAIAAIDSLPLTPDLRAELTSLVDETGRTKPFDRGRLRESLLAALRSSGPVHALGTDALGQDVLAQMIHASRLAISIGLVSTGIAVLIGVAVGAVMGFFGGAVDLVLYRVVEIFMAVPLLFVLIVAAAVLPRNIYVTMCVIGGFTWMGAARFTRAEFLRLRNLDFVLAARAAGVPLRSILFRHMLPNGVTPVLVDASFGIALAIIFEATLSYLGLGAEGQASWGRLLADATSEAGDFVWWLAVLPGAAIFLTAMSFNLMGEALRDAVDPRLRAAGSPVD